LITALKGGDRPSFGPFSRTYPRAVRLIGMKKARRKVAPKTVVRKKGKRREKAGSKQGVFDWGLRGGAREGAGRPRKEGAVCHRKRERVSRHHPVHVTAHLVPGLRSMRVDALQVVREALAAGSRGKGFRLCEYSIQSNHLHLIVEAEDGEGLSLGLRGLFTRVARRFNRFWGRSGKVFEGRAHRHILRTPREVKNALRYLFFNGLKHESQTNVWVFDLCSSAAWFDGWEEEVPPEVFRWMPDEPGTLPAETWLLTTGWWKHHGLLSLAQSRRSA